MRKPSSFVDSSVGFGMASKGKGHKSGRGRDGEEFELEDDRVDAEPPEGRAYRRLPFGTHRYDPIHPPVPPAGTNRQALVDELIEQLPMLTEKGLREVNLALSHELKPWKPVNCLTMEVEDLVAMMMLKKNLMKESLGVAIVGIGKMMDQMVFTGVAMQIGLELG